MTEIFNMLVQTLKDNLSEEFTVTSAIVRKNNNTKHYSISLRKVEELTASTLYVDDILEDIGNSKISVSDGVKQVLVKYDDAIKHTPASAKPKLWSSKSFVLKHVYYQLINEAANKAMLRNVLHWKILDLAVVFRVVVDETQDTSYMYIPKDEVEKQGWFTFTELNAAADYNTRAKGFVHIPFSENMNYTATVRQPYLLTNFKEIDGANILLFPKELAKIADIFEEDFYIIPFSIHKIVGYPVSLADKELLLKILRVSNTNPVVIKKEDILGSHLYRYNRKTGTVTFA